MSIETQPVSVEAKYVGYGVHPFELADGRTVTTVSEEEWGRFTNSLARLAEEDCGDIVLTPELMTFVYPYPEQGQVSRIVKARLAEVMEISKQLPESSLTLLGSARYERGLYPPPTSQYFIKSGQIVDINNKFSRISHERPFRAHNGELTNTIDPEYTPRYIGGTILTAICSDIMILRRRPDRKQRIFQSGGYTKGDPITANTNALLVSSCWAVPAEAPEGPMDKSQETIERRDSEYRGHLEKYITDLFTHHPSIQDVVIADRLNPISGVEAPYTAHFRRKT